MIPLVAAGLAYGGGQLIKGVSDYFGNQSAARERRRGINNAKADLTGGYNKAVGTLQPLADQGMKDFGDFGNRVRTGQYDISAPEKFQADKFSWDPNSIFEDPEYKANMSSGTEAINSGAAAKGQTFGGTNLRDLTEYGQGVYANRSDELYDRARNAYQFDTGTQQQAHDQDFTDRFNANQSNYGRMKDLASYGPASLDRLATLHYGYGSDQGNLDINKGNSNAEGALGMSGAIGNTFSGLGQTAASGLLLPGAPQDPNLALPNFTRTAPKFGT